MALLPRVRRFAAGLARHPADGDDLCQATVERALQKRDQWQPGTRLDSWMYRMMRNIWIDEQRARAERAEIEKELAAASSLPAEETEELREKLDLAAARTNLQKYL
mgnify:CR=1 FL=1